jgi:hypothetical protein
VDVTTDKSRSFLNSMFVHGSEVRAGVAHRGRMFAEFKSASTGLNLVVTFVSSKSVDHVNTILLGDTVDSGDASLSARNKLVRSDFPVSRARLLFGFAKSVALVLRLELGFFDDRSLRSARSFSNTMGSFRSLVSTARIVKTFTATRALTMVIILVEDSVGAFRALGNNRSFVTTSVSFSLSTDFTATPGRSSVVASSGVINLFLGVESLLSKSSTSDHSKSLSFFACSFLTSNLG